MKYKREWPHSVYLVLDAKNDRVKIGYASVPKQRLRTLQSASPSILSLALTITFQNKDAAEAFERHLHDRFDGYRIRGEWFEDGAIILDYVRHQYCPSPEQIQAYLKAAVGDLTPADPIKQREMWVMLKTVQYEADEEEDEYDELSKGMALLAWRWYEDEAAMRPEAIAQANAFAEYAGLAA